MYAISVSNNCYRFVLKQIIYVSQSIVQSRSLPDQEIDKRKAKLADGQEFQIVHTAAYTRMVYSES